MDILNTLVTALDHVRWFHVVGIILVWGLLFGKKKLWEFEAKLFVEGSSDYRGEIEIKKLAKSPTMCELKIIFDSPFIGSIDIVVNKTRIGCLEVNVLESSCTYHDMTVPIQKPVTPTFSTRKHHVTLRWSFPVHENIDLNENDKAELVLNRTEKLVGVFLRD